MGRRLVRYWQAWSSHTNQPYKKVNQTLYFHKLRRNGGLFSGKTDYFDNKGFAPFRLYHILGVLDKRGYLNPKSNVFLLTFYGPTN